LETLDEVVEEAARRYAARCWWADLEDLRQEAWSAVLQAKTTHDPAKGELTGYAWQAAIYALRALVWSQSSPVYAPRKKLPALAGMHRAEMSTDMPAPQVDLVDQLHTLRMMAEVIPRVQELAREGRLAEEVSRVLLGGERPSVVAREAGLPEWHIWKATAKVRQRIAEDPAIQALVHEVRGET